MPVSVSDPLAPGRHGAPGTDPVRIAVEPRGVVQLAARKDRAGDLAARVQAGLGIALPGAGHAGYGDDMAALWVQPEAWMLLAPHGIEGACARRIKDAAGDAGSVVDQTHGRSVFTLSGSRAAWVLNKLCRIDLHPSAFATGSVAATPVGGLACVVHQSAAATYELVVFTTFLRSFAEMLTHAADEVGYVIT
jgi:sarcosine oxidase subunit gamma